MERKFLRQVAAYYGSKAPSALGGYTFVTPNKRSAMFLKRYLRDTLKGEGPVLLPRFATFSRMLTHFADYGEGGRNELLFTLYESVREVYVEAGRTEGPGSFDSFIFWGDMMLSDFNEIDMSLADAGALFKNIRNIKEIQSDFLDDEQKEIVRRLWGESRLTRDSKSVKTGESEFWLHLSNTPEGDGMRNSFKSLWDLQGRIYETFHRKLREKGMGTPGATARAAWKRIKWMSVDELPYPTHYVFVGFGDPTTVETLVMKRFHDLGIADFFWDIRRTQAMLGAKGPTNKSIARIEAMAKELSEPPDFEAAPAGTPRPEVEVIASPSKTAQAKAVHNILKQWIAEGVMDTSNPVNTAIVLPDENLLMPVLFSLPEEIEAINITMGVPYSTTTFAKLLEGIMMMQRRAHTTGEETTFFYEDVVAVLGHPHIRLLCGAAVDKVLKRIHDEHVFNVSPALVAEADAELGETIFTAVSGQDAEGVAAYLTRLIDWLSEGLERTAKHKKSDMLETKLLGHFRREVGDIMALVRETGVEMNERSFFILLDRMFSTAQIGVNGKPLQGLQIMGVLETRALDFENVIILSMNEGTFPRKQYGKTMIPNALRMAYGLPELNAGEGVYAYCFYRLIAGAERVRLLYDSRTGVSGAGEESRYIAQLKYLLPELEVGTRTLMLPASFSQGRTISVKKDGEVAKALKAFEAGGDKYLSASSLKTYLSCPLQFYLSNVAGLRPDAEMVKYVTAAEYGQIFHRVFQNLYKSYEGGKEVQEDDITRWLKAPEKYIRPLIDAAIFEFRHPRRFNKKLPAPPQTSEEETVAEAIYRMIQKLLKQEAECFTADGGSFRYIKGEMEVVGPWQITPERKVNFRMYIDRVEEPEKEKLRFIDYKTGTDATTVDIEQLTNPDYSVNSGAVFQLLTYCEAYKDMEKFDGAIQPMVYSIRHAFAGTALDPIRYGKGRGEKQTLDDFRDVSSTFRPQLENLVNEIFDETKPFEQCEESKGCSGFCPFLALCGRTPKTW